MSKIVIRSGKSLNELQNIKVVDLEEPIGWITITLNLQDASGNIVKPYIQTMNMQINIHQNQHNERDTQIRHIKIFGIREYFQYSKAAKFIYAQFFIS